jgi:hypothetical protein
MLITNKLVFVFGLSHSMLAIAVRLVSKIFITLGLVILKFEVEITVSTNVLAYYGTETITA